MGEPTTPPTGEVRSLTVRQVFFTIITLEGMGLACRPYNSVAGVVHMALFRRGYEFQSRVLRIPDRYGLFWAAPFEPQAEQTQGYLFAATILLSFWFLVTFMPMALLLALFKPEDGVPIVKLFGVFAFSPFVFVWLLSVCYRLGSQLGIHRARAAEARK